MFDITEYLDDGNEVKDETELTKIKSVRELMPKDVAENQRAM